MTRGSPRAIAWWLALFLFSVYVLSYSGRMYSQDSMSMFSVTESFVKRGDFDTDQLWTLFKARNEIAPDGESYSKYGYGVSLFSVPLYALALALPGLGLVQTTLLTSSVAIALAGALVFLSARRMGYSMAVSACVALLFGLATPAWVYAKQLWSEPYCLVTLFAAFYYLLCYRGERRQVDAILAALALGLAIATRTTNVALVLFYAWYGFSGARRDARMRRGLALFAVVLGLLLLSIGWYDWVRYGSPLATGYRADETFSTPLLQGLYGLLLSPGRGLFVYVPFLIVLPWSLAALWRSARDETILALAISAIYLLVFATWYYWWAGTNWATRFLVPLLPFLVLAVAPVVEVAARVLGRLGERRPLIESAAAHEAPGWAPRLAGRGAPTHAGRVRSVLALFFVALCGASAGIEVLGISIPSLWYRLYMVGISKTPDHDAIYLPQFSPIVGYLRMLHVKNLDFGWVRVVAEKVSIDWLAVVLGGSLVLLCSAGLARAWVGAAQRRSHLASALVCAAAVALFCVHRSGADTNYGGGAGYAALLQTLHREAALQDVLVVNNDVQASFFFNENRTRMRWYGLSRDPKQWDEKTRTLLMTLSERYARVWFALDDSAGDAADPVRVWMEQSWRRVQQYDFADGVHLILFSTGAAPAAEE